MPARFAAAVLGALVLTLGGCSAVPSVLPGPPPPPVTVTVPVPLESPAVQQDSGSGTESESDSGSSGSESTPSTSYDNCRWMDESTGWHCRSSVGEGYFDVPDDDPGIGSCAGQTYDECSGVESGSAPTSTEVPDSGSGGGSGEGSLESQCSDVAWRQSSGTEGDIACGSTERP